jgi:hypothetical protein
MIDDRVLAVEVKGALFGELGPGAVLGERNRTATLRAVTACRVAASGSEGLDPQVLSELAPATTVKMPRTYCSNAVAAPRALFASGVDTPMSLGGGTLAALTKPRHSEPT